MVVKFMGFVSTALSCAVKLLNFLVVLQGSRSSDFFLATLMFVTVGVAGTRKVFVLSSLNS